MTDLAIHQPINTYIMHPLIQETYKQVHNWFESKDIFSGYKSLSYPSDRVRVLQRKNLKDAAFNFNLYFPTHYFKVCHALESEPIIGFDLLSAWLRYNPYLTIIDVGCGDGAASVAVVDSILKLRERGLIDTRQVQLYILGIDKNSNGLVIFQQVLNELSQSIINFDIDLNFEIIPKNVSESSGYVENKLSKLRKYKWNQPSLSHAIMLMSNITDILYEDHQSGNRELSEYLDYDISTQEPFGELTSIFIKQLFRGVPIDHLHILSIDTKPDLVINAIDDMIDSITSQMSECGHVVESNNPTLEEINFINPEPSYWYKKRNNSGSWKINPYVVYTCHIHNHDLAADERWKKITSTENLGLAWARARRAILRESYSDEIDIRIFEKDLDSNISRLQFELQNYAIQLGYIKQTMYYGFPKSKEKDRPRGLNWLEEEILITAIIQIIGIPILRDKPWSFAYRLAPENSIERGDTEYLYERWSEAWIQYREAIQEYIQKYEMCIIIKTDIKSYFTQIPQKKFQEIFNTDFRISHRIQWLLELLVTKEIKNHEPGFGLVQGSIGSGFFANLYLSKVDNLFPSNDQKHRRLFRYMDDIVIIVPDSSDKDITYNKVLDEINNLGLEINLSKTETFQRDDFINVIEPDDVLDNYHNYYENLVDSLWYMNDKMRYLFSQYSSLDESWWALISRYRDCLIEVNFYLSHSQLSREINRSISREIPEEVKVLDIPDFPDISTISKNKEWAKLFKANNQNWLNQVDQLKNDLITFFTSNYEILFNEKTNLSQIELEKISRRLRFTVNRLGFLGFDLIHDNIKEILIFQPWIIRYLPFIMESLAIQGYKEDIWTIFNHHYANSREMSSYMCAIALRALRFTPYLDITEWKELVNYLFVKNEIIQLMASETWLFSSAKMESVPLEKETVKKLLSYFINENELPLRLKKNFILMLGKLAPNELNKIDLTSISQDPILNKAFEIAKKGDFSNLFLQTEPDIIREKYYSNIYRHFDDRSDGS